MRDPRVAKVKADGILQREKEKNGVLEQEKKLAQHCHRINDAFKRILQTDKVEELKI